MKVALLLMLSLTISDSYARGWFCEEVASVKTADGYDTCGVGTSRDEAEARSLALKNAEKEFNHFCKTEPQCMKHKVVAKPQRIQCIKQLNKEYKCRRLVSYIVTDIEKDIDEEIATLKKRIKELEAEFTQKKEKELLEIKKKNLEEKIKKKEYREAAEKDYSSGSFAERALGSFFGDRVYITDYFIESTYGEDHSFYHETGFKRYNDWSFGFTFGVGHGGTNTIKVGDVEGGNNKDRLYPDPDFQVKRRFLTIVLGSSFTMRFWRFRVSPTFDMGYLGGTLGKENLFSTGGNIELKEESTLLLKYGADVSFLLGKLLIYFRYNYLHTPFAPYQKRYITTGGGIGFLMSYDFI